MSRKFTAVEMAAAKKAAEEGKTHLVAWGRSNRYGYEVEVYDLPDLCRIYSGYSNRKFFYELDRTTGINLIGLRRSAKNLSRSAY